MEPLTIAITYVSKKLLDQLIADQGYGWLKRLCFPKKKYKNELVSTIYSTIDDFEKRYPIDNKNTSKFPFYHSQILLEELSKYVLFKKYENAINLKEKFRQNPNIIIPADKELKEFYSTFLKKVSQNKTLKKLFIKENYQEEVFNISGIVNKIYSIIGFLPSDKWFEKQCERSIDDLGKRYTPKLNLELEISDIFESIGRTEKFEKKFINFVDNLLIKGEKVVSQSERINELGDISKELKCKLNKILNLSKKIDYHGISLFPANEFLKLLKSAQSSTNKIEDYFYAEEGKIKKEKNEYRFYQKYGYEINNVRDFIHELYVFIDYLKSKEFALANNPFLLLYGEAGIGKSHLLGDIVSRRIRNGYQSIFILGQHLNTKEDPRIQILKKLQLKVNFEEFLNTLNELAERQKKRIIIFIDAINEGQGKYFWPENIRSFINEIKKYKWLGLVLSVRTSYKKLIFPDELSGKLSIIEIEHFGFSGVEYAASKLFFSNYGIEYPNTPLLHPEFQNPLFLKLFCEGLKRNNLTRMPDGLQGISSIIDFFINGINKELSNPNKLDYPEGINLVKKSIQAIIEYKLQNKLRYVPYKEAYKIIESVFRDYTTKKGIIEYLISVGVFSKNLFWAEKDTNEEGIYLAYERFEDHLTAQLLLKKYQNIEEEFKEGGNLYYLVEDEQAIKINKGLIDALTILLPEKTKKDFFEIVPHLKGSYEIADSLIESLLWRKVESITDITKQFIQDYELKYKGETHDLFWEVLISVSTIPNHPFNAYWLHNLLMSYTMPDRDSWWTVLLRDKFYDEYAIKRLIDWAWNEDDKSHISNESIKLASITLAWFHTSTNRKLRDIATKAMVSLLQNRIDVLIEVLKLFEKVNDPYVYERLFSVAYGCSLRTEQHEKIQKLAEYIYETIFKDKEEIYPHALLRDYARGVIEYTIYLGYKLSFNIDEIRPPYKSYFPDTLPSNDEIDSKYKLDYNSEDFKDYHWGQNRILSSMVTEYGRGCCSYGDFGRYTFESALRSFDVNANLMSNLAVQWTFEKYGYDVEKHGKYDNEIHSSRNEHRIERIGKKYQWIALYEMIARVSDNFKKYDTWYSSDKKENPYQGPWDPYIRDIDPTMLIKNTGIYNEENPTRFWWTKEGYSNWEVSNRDWAKISDDLPSCENIIQVKDESNEEWLVLEAYPEWAEPKPIGKEKWENPHKRLWYQIRSYLVKKEDSHKIKSWAIHQNFMGRWMPESNYRYEIFSREYYWSPAYQYFLTEYYNGNEWREIIDPKTHHHIGNSIVTTESFLWEEEFDFSKEETISFLKPCNKIYQGMDLQFSTVEGEFIDKNNQVVCFAANVNNDSESYLLIKKKPFLEFLDKNDLDIFWTILGEKQIIGGFSSSKEYVGRLEISGAYFFEDGNLKGEINTKIE